MNEDDAAQSAPQVDDSSRSYSVRFLNGEMATVKADAFVIDKEDYMFSLNGHFVLAAPRNTVVYAKEVVESAS